MLQAKNKTNNQFITTIMMTIINYNTMEYKFYYLTLKIQ